jgi:hypothetical protein
MGPFAYAFPRGVLINVNCDLAPEGVPIPTHNWSRSKTGLGGEGGTSVVSAYMMRLLVGPRE